MVVTRRIPFVNDEGDLVILTVREDRTHGTGLKTATLTNYGEPRKEDTSGNPAAPTKRR
jgi:hypothetical protein